jgi:hypothetical protein
MTFENPGDGPLDYFPCRYGKSRLVFRGPSRTPAGDYLAFIGGSETYGKFIEHPFPDLVEDDLGLPCLNFGLMNAGIDVYLNDPVVIDLAAQARHCVVQVMGANNLNNRFYAVHPRRNDRFLRASSLMQTVFREVDFTEFHFTRHMLGTLAAVAPERFNLVIDEVQQAWLARMGILLDKLGEGVVLLWFSDHAPEDKDEQDQTSNDPFAIKRWMIDRIRGRVAEVVEVVASAGALAQGVEGMVFSDLDAPAAQSMLGLRAHDEVAGALTRALSDLLAT